MKKLLILVIAIMLLGVFYIKDMNALAEEKQILKGTTELELLKAIAGHNLNNIKNILDKNLKLVNSQKLSNKITPLIWAVQREYEESVKVLLEHGADPNIIADYNNTALFESISVSTNKDYDFDRNINITKLLLKYGADPNIAAYCKPKINGISSTIICGTTPLIKAATRSLKKVKLLVEYGADINAKNIDGTTTAAAASLRKQIDIAYYLIVTRNANFSYPIIPKSLKNIPGISMKVDYPISYLRNWLVKLGSEEHKKKMEIVEHLKKQGIDYSKTKPSKRKLQQIQKLYPNTWTEYLKKY
ncbi:MAG: ankyrin repeat domain-containing protein [Arcobacteraceae bacterium]|nr:ankyrin repeat domain-containing protein [Arcobacteraceae bacterium]